MVTRGFIRAWRKWQHSSEPASNFNNRRGNAPTYGIECALDHLASYVYSLCTSAIGNVDWDYPKLASEQLAELDRINSELEKCAISEPARQEFREYISATRALLEELRGVSKNKN